MQRVTREQYPLDALQRAVKSVTFFKDLIHSDSSQFEMLMSVSQFVTAEPDEIIIHKGDDANILYFLLKGQLAVISDDESQQEIGQINPGEPFGVMAMLLNFKRSASIKVSNNKSVLLAGIDFSYFNDIEEFEDFSLSTKATFYRMLSNNLRWALEQNKMKSPDHPMVAKIRTIPLISAMKDTPAELQALHEQVHVLAELVNEWNQAESD